MRAVDAAVAALIAAIVATLLSLSTGGDAAEALSMVSFAAVVGTAVTVVVGGRQSEHEAAEHDRDDVAERHRVAQEEW